MSDPSTVEDQLTVTVEKLPASEVTLKIEAPMSAYEHAWSHAVSHLGSRVRIPGFRPGKAPEAVLEQKVGHDALHREAVEHLIPELYLEALAKSSIEPVGDPKVELQAAERGKPVQFTATVTVRPEIDLGDLKTLKVKEEHTEVTDKELDELIEQIQRRHATYTDVERPIKSGDLLRGTLIMKKGEEVVGGDTMARDIDVDPERLIPGILENLEGMKIGEEKKFTVKLPDDFNREDLRNQEVEVSVSCTGVRERKLPEINDELAKLDGHGETLEELKTFYHQALVGETATRDRNAFAEKVFDELRSRVKVDIPPAMIDREVDRQLNEFAIRLESIGLPLQKYVETSGETLEHLRAQRHESSVRTVKLQLALDAVVRALALDIDETQVEREAQNFAKGRKLDNEQKRRLWMATRRDLERQAAIEQLLDMAKA